MNSCIAADIGGTNTRFALVSTADSSLLYEQQYLSRDFDQFESMLNVFIDNYTADFSGTVGRIDSLSLAFPGVVSDEVATLTNLPWVIHKKVLLERFKADRVHFMNDFQASAMGLSGLTEHDKVILNNGVYQAGQTSVVTGAGTGLGMAWVQHTEQGIDVYATEGGHVDFSPTNKIQIELLEFMMRRYNHVSYERLLSGSGLVALYEFVSGQADSDIAAADVSSLAEENQSNAVQAIRLFVEIYGAYVGNLALTFKPQSGIYITGGIGTKIQSWMKSENFISAFLEKGRMSTLVESIPVYLVINEKVGILGAANYCKVGANYNDV